MGGTRQPCLHKLVSLAMGSARPCSALRLLRPRAGATQTAAAAWAAARAPAYTASLPCKPRPPQDHRVVDWVEHGLGLPQYAAAFKRNAVTALDFPLLAGDGGATLAADLGVASKLHQHQVGDHHHMGRGVRCRSRAGPAAVTLAADAASGPAQPPPPPAAATGLQLMASAGSTRML